jgi:hypothetical protein
MSTNGKICVRCQVELRCQRNGVCLVEMTVHGPGAVWMADIWHCPSCRLQVIPGTLGKEPLARGDREKVEAEIAGARSRGEQVFEFWANARERDLRLIPQ